MMRKTTAALLILAFTASPFQFIFAQDTPIIGESTDTSTPAPPTSEVLSDTESIAPVTEVTALESIETVSPTPEESTATETSASTEEMLRDESDALPPEGGSEGLLDSSDEPSPPVDSPNLFGTNSTPRVDKNMGALTQHIALDIPPGRNGLAPDLSLDYNSQQREDGIAGYGWTVSIPYIERYAKTGTDRLYIDYNFRSSMDGELSTTTTAGEYRARIESGSFLAYTFSTSTNRWTVFDKNGTRYSFGTTTAAQQAATTSPTQVSKWMLEEVRDRNNNYISYSYLKSGNQIYPLQIKYTGFNTTDGIFAIDFSYASRTDPIISYKTGYRVTTTDRLSRIQASVSGSWVRQYDLSYIAGVNGARSLLSSIQKTGRNADGSQLALPALSFLYSSSTPAYELHSNPRITSNAFVAAEIDGNGLSDRSVFYQNPVNLNVYSTIDLTNYGTSGPNSAPEYWSIEDVNYSGGYRPVERGIRLFDMTGDGKADLVKGSNNMGTVTQKWWENRSSTSTVSFVEQSYGTSTIPIFAYFPTGDTVETAGILGEVNGDGLLDVVMASSTGDRTNLHMASTTGWVATSTQFIPISGIPQSSNASAVQLVDINGDGLDDWMRSDEGLTKFCMNTGTDWETSCGNGWYIATSTRHANGWDRGIRFIDFNGDGLRDYVRSYSVPAYSSNTASHIEVGTYNYVYLNTGSGWATSTLNIPSSSIFSASLAGSVWMGTYSFSELVDWNGDGILDTNEYSSVSTSTIPDLLTKIVYPEGGSTEVSYAQTAQLLDTSSNLPYSVLIVTSLTTKDSFGNSEVHTYDYTDGKMYLGSTDIRDRRFAGFRRVVDRGPLGQVVNYFNQGDYLAIGDGELTDSYAQIGRVFREDKLTLASSTMERVFTRHDTFDFSSTTRTFVFPSKQLTQSYDGGSAHKDKAVEYTYATSTGALTQTYELGEVVGSSDGTYTETGSDVRATIWTYAVSTTTTNLTLPIRELVQNSASTTVKETKYTYNSIPYGFITTGNKTKEENWIAGSTYASTTRTYTTYGLVATSTDPRGYATSFSYDTNNLYVSTSTNPLLQQTSYMYNLSNGKVATSTDPNGAVRALVFDPVGRVTAERVSDIGTPTSIVTKTTYTYNDTFPTSILTTRYLTSSTSTDAYQYRDGLGRPIQDRLRAAGTNTYTVKDFMYGSNGLLNRESLPYFASSTSRSSATTTAYLYTQYVYDALGRVVDVGNAIASTTYTFSAWTATTTDMNGNVKGLKRDAYGNLASVTEGDNDSYYVTTYTYDVLNNLTKITDALANVRNFTYDGVGRRSSGEDLHASGDATFGTWAYAYDRAGNLASSTDPKSQVVEYTYDALNRPTAENYTGSSGTEITYLYDFCPKGKGRLCVASTTDSFTSKTYNVLGQLSGEARRLNSMSFASTTFFYDRQGNVASTTYPDGTVVVNGYNIAGQVSDVKVNAAGTGSLVPAITHQEYGPTGAVTSRAYANTVTIPYTYNASQLYRLLRIGNAASTTGGVNTNSLDLESGSSQYAYHTDASAFDITGDMTIEAWVNFESLPATDSEMVIVGKYDFDNNSRSYRFAYSRPGGTLKLQFTNSANCASWTDGLLSYTLATSTWYHLAVSKSGTTATFYVNGSSVGTASVESAQCNGTGSFSVGSIIGNSPTFYFDGLVDDVRVWNTARSGSQIADNRSFQVLGSESGLAAYYRLNNDGYADRTSSSNTLTPMNSPTFSASVPFVGGETSGGGIQSILYTYDNVGNITTISDTSDTLTLKEIVFTYDDLNRVVTASTTVASTTSYREVYSYNALGNLLNKASTTPESGGTNSYALDFELASSSYAYHTDASAFDTTGDMTIEAWVKLESSPSSGNTYAIAGKYDFDNNQRSYYLGYFNDSGTFKLRFVTSSACNNFTEGDLTQTLSTDTWTHVAVSKSGTTATFYVNGSSAGTATVNSSQCDGTGKFSIGSIVGNSPTFHFDGVIDEVRLWSTARSGSDISTYKDSQLQGDETSLAAYYKLNGSFVDATANANTLTQSGSPAFTSSVPFVGGSSSGDQYLYAGTSYANPHAPTSISGTTLTYDNSGNLTAYGTTTYAYDYRNRLTQAVLAGATTTYAYDHEVNRTRQTIASTTTWYPNKFFSRTATTTSATASATTTAYIYVGDTLVATIDRIFTRGTVTATTTRYIHPDHLGSTNVVTNASGTPVQTLDYYPYGSPRINSQVASANTSRQYIGQFTDTNSLNYLNARYYEGSRGQFLNQDPMFWALKQSLQDPQSLNSYSYANGNPIVKKDPEGKFAFVAAPLLLAPEYAPLLYGGFVLGGASLLTYISQLNLPDPTKFQTGTLADSGPRFLQYPNVPPPGESPEFNPNMGKGAGLILTIGIVGEVAHRVWEYKDEIKKAFRFWNPAAQGPQSPIRSSSNSTTVQDYRIQIPRTGSITHSQTTALTGVVSAFTPTTSAQAQVLQNLVNVFTSR